MQHCPHGIKIGFTLIELSIVLVIIGLIVGGVIVGQSLIRQSQLNSAVTDEQRYVQAIMNFRQKYSELPGDMADATTYWGTGTTCPPTYASPLSGQLTCNGDGNGQIGVSGAWTISYPEMFLAWQHLVNAQMIQGSYNGSPGSAGTEDHVIGKNCPASRVDGAGFGIKYMGTQNGSTWWFDGSYGHQIIIGGYQSNNWPATKIMTTNEAYSIDAKYDDGLPAYGNITTLKPVAFPCATTAVSSTAQYDPAQAGYSCALLFTTGF